MTSLHVGMNSIPEKEMKEIITTTMRKDSMKILCEVPIKDKTLTMLDISGKNLGMEGAVVVAEYLRDNGALTKFDISSNEIGAEGGQFLAAALKGNQVMMELNISSNYLAEDSNENPDMSGVVAIADAIPDMGALTKLDISGNDIGAEQEGGLQRICVAGGIELAK